MVKICDLHNDYLTELDCNEKIEEYLTKQNSLQVLLSPIWTTKLKDVKNFASEKKKLLSFVKPNFHTKICFEDMNFFDDDFTWLKNINPFFCGLVWNEDNKYAGGAYGKGKLTKKGKILVQNLEKRNIYVDTAHMNICTFNNFTSITTKPIFCSHTGFCDIALDKRNLTKQQIMEIIKSKGLVGLFFVGKYISKQKVTIEDVVHCIDHFVCCYDYNNLAIGTDFYGSKDLPSQLKTYNQFELLKEKLNKIGYSNEVIDAIFYKNFLNFIKRDFS